MAHVSGRQIGKHARVLTAALAIGAAVLSLSAGPAHAAINGGGGTVKCKYTTAYGTVIYEDVGATVWDVFTGTRKTCGADGKWHLELPPQTNVAPKPAGGAVLAP